MIPNVCEYMVKSFSELAKRWMSGSTSKKHNTGTTYLTNYIHCISGNSDGQNQSNGTGIALQARESTTIGLQTYRSDRRSNKNVEILYKEGKLQYTNSFMFWRKENMISVEMDGEEVENAGEFVYMGSLLT